MPETAVTNVSSEINDEFDQDIYELLSSNIQRLMTIHGDVQKSLSLKTQLSQKTICNCLDAKGKTKPNISTLSQIAKAYDMQVWELFAEIPDWVGKPDEVISAESSVNE